MYLIDFVVVVAAVAVPVAVVVLAAVSIVSDVNCRSGFARVFFADFYVLTIEIGFAGRLKDNGIMSSYNLARSINFTESKDIVV